VISLLTLVLSAPLWATAAVLVRLTSSGAAFFSQERIGRRGQRFILYKIRTMTDNARGPAITTSGDRRVTRLGRILRKFKIDELPQLWNVVKGDMSLVGPRPEVPEYVRLEDPLWAHVLSVRPGITDPVTIKLRDEETLLAQVQQERERYYLDVLQPYKLQGYISYLERRSWSTDLRVLGQTLIAVVAPRNEQQDVRRVKND